MLEGRRVMGPNSRHNLGGGKDGPKTHHRFYKKKYNLNPESIEHSDPNFDAERQQGDGNTIKI